MSHKRFVYAEMGWLIETVLNDGSCLDVTTTLCFQLEMLEWRSDDSIKYDHFWRIIWNAFNYYVTFGIVLPKRFTKIYDYIFENRLDNDQIFFKYFCEYIFSKRIQIFLNISLTPNNSVIIEILKQI